MRRWCIIVLALLLGCHYAVSQELLVPAVGYGMASPQEKNGAMLQLPFFDDFASLQGVLNSDLWADGQAFVSFGFGPLPPTVGVVTLDAVDAAGRLYTNTTEPTSADTLTSQAVRLDSILSPIPCSLSPADSVYLSFYYLPGGSYGAYRGRVGDMPEAADSLVLEFYSTNDGVWSQAWGREGVDADSLYAQTGEYWQHVMVPITDQRYFSKGFRFRFRNVISLDASTTVGLVANSDQWHVDCIRLDRNRTVAEPCDRDIAFVNPAPSLLSQYTAMPVRQYRGSDMASTLDMKITNRYSQPLASHYGFTVYSPQGEELYSYDGGYENAPSYPATHGYQTSTYHAKPSLAYSYPEGIRGTYTVVHCVREGVAGDLYSANDTVVFLQEFDNYYAYDDGTAENGYGLTSTSSNVFLASLYCLATPDTLEGVRLYFNQTREAHNATMGFRLAVWADNGGHPGTLLYLDSQVRFPRFEGLNQYVDYPLERALPLSGQVYIGFQQETNQYINIGFDRNNNHADRIFYRIGSEWQHCSFAGAMMLRPYFTLPQYLGVMSAEPASQVRIYPNPARDHFGIVGCDEDATVTVFDQLGRQTYSGRAVEPVVTLGWPQGIYFVRIANRQTIVTHKIIITQ